MFRNLLFAIFAALAVVGPAALAPQTKAATTAPAARYAVHYRKANGAWAYYGTFNARTAHNVSRQLKTRGFGVALRAAGSTVSPLNTARHPGERSKVVASGAFPSLGNNFEVLAAETPRYNCIAWSCGITKSWVWPGANVADFDRLYAQHGYRRINTLDYRKQAGVQKVVLYGHVKQNNGRQIIQCTHASRQLKDGTWSSKLGKLPLIRHLTPDSIDGFGSSQYGQPVAVYVRAAR